MTLAWSDPAGPNLQDDLDLIVIAADGSERHGNTGTGRGFDRTNNVEHLPPGAVKVIIRALWITRFAQPYAYTWRIQPG